MGAIETETYIRDKRNEIKCIKAEIFEAQSKRWEDLYKDCCKDYFLTLDEFIDTIAFDNSFEGYEKKRYIVLEKVAQRKQQRIFYMERDFKSGRNVDFN